MEFILGKVSQVAQRISPQEADAFIELLIKAPRVYLIGAGRSGLVARAFGMRLVHLRKKVFIVGETITPALRRADVLVAVSGSGKTTWVVETARAARQLGGRVAALTWDRNSQLAQLAELVVLVPSEALPRQVAGYTTRELMGIPPPPLGSLFEISTLVFFEACVLELMSRLGIAEEEMRRIHANL
jgi:6-phospho 3-hexuloisomerase